MCGICGILSFDGAPVSGRLLQEMNDTMILRGPDDSGHYIENGFGMAMRRLSIIDLEGGHQPISNENGNISVVLNGEIYNYIELRQNMEGRGHRFTTQSDTEVLVHLYEEYGTDAVKHLNGMFAFAIWDSPRKRLWVVRDRLGIKPLVYFKSQKGLVFASTIEALACHPDFKKEIDNENLLLYFMLAYIPTPLTIWKQAYKLPPAHWILIENGKLKLERYWQPEPMISNFKRRKEFVAETRNLLHDSIELHSRSDVPVGTFLSGGLDSSSITSLFCLRSTKTVHTFTMDFEGKPNNEGDYARLVADQNNTEHHALSLNSETALETLGELLPLMDEPMADSAIIPSFLLAKAARDAGIKVVLCGAGGDELFGGYSRHYPNRRDSLAGLMPLKSPQIWSLVAKALSPRLAHYGMLTWDKGVAFGTNTSGVQLGHFARMLKDPTNFQKSMALVKEQFAGLNNNKHSLGFGYSRMLTDVQNYLVDNVLAIADRTTMAASVEARVPLLDHRLVELAFGTSPLANISNCASESKISFKQAIAQYIPSTILNLPKTGFNGPVLDWIRQGSPQMEKYILKPRHSAIEELFDIEILKRTWKNPKAREEASEFLFMIFVADQWLEIHA